jgi:hypothetical protein
MTGLTELRGTGEVGSISNLPSVGGRIVPGLGGNGTLTCSNLTLVPNNFLTFVAEIAGPTHGRLRTRGIVTLGAGTRLQLSVTGPAPVGAPLVIIDNVGPSPVSGTFLALTNQALITTNGQIFRVRYDGGDGNDVTLTRVVLPTGVTRVWDGGGPNDLWTTSANWGGGVAPSPGDRLRFPLGAARRTNQNDFPPGTVFDSIEVTGGRYEWSGQQIGLFSGIRVVGATGEGLSCSLPLTLAASITISNAAPSAMDLLKPIDLGPHTLTFGCSNFTTIRVQSTAHISGAGGLLKVGAGDVAFFGSNSFAGPLLVTQGEYGGSDSSLGSTNGGTTVLPGARLDMRGSNIIREALILGGRLEYSSASNRWAGPIQITGINASIDASSSLIISGRITGAESNSTVTIGPFGTVFLTAFNDYFRTIVQSANLVVNSGQPGNEIVLIEGGTLSGTGTVGPVRNEASGGFVAPDSSFLSFGRLSVGALAWTPAMTYRAEVRSFGPGVGHDMLDVTGAVNLGGATLQLSNTFVGTPFIEEFVIVNNDGNDAVAGTFAGLPEGTLITNDPAVFRLSYVGGDGNDVTLTTLGTEIRANGILSLPNGAKQINGSGFPDFEHVLEATPVLLTPPAAIPWQPIQTNQADATGFYQFIDFGATNFPTRFYRVRLPTAE